MPQGIILGRSLQIGRDRVVGIMLAARQVGGLPAAPMPLVDDLIAFGAAPAGPDGVAFRIGHRHLERELLARPHAGHGVQNLAGAEKIERTHFVVRAPASPILRRVAQNVRDVGSHGMAHCRSPQPAGASLRLVIVWLLGNSSRPAMPCSTPTPDCLCPPNGALGRKANISLIQTVPVSSRAPIARAWSRSFDHTDPPSPVSLSFARRMTSSISSYFSSGSTGPKASSVTTRDFSGGLSTIEMGMK